MYRRNAFWGIALILFGVLILLSRIYNFNMNMEFMWPIFVLIPGLMFELGYFVSGRAAGILVPGGILTTIGLLFFFETFTNWNFAEYTWPVYLLAVAFGLFQLFLFGGRNKGLLIPVSILTVIAIIAFILMFFSNVFSWLNSSLILPIALIIVGLFMIFKYFRH